MSNKEEFDFFVEQLLSNAIKDFRATEQYSLLREKLDRMDRECDFNISPSDRGFVEECFEQIIAADGQQEHFVYRQGMLDCVKVLKWLGVLS